MGTIVELPVTLPDDVYGERWQRLAVPGEWCWSGEHHGYQNPCWRWRRVTFEGPVTVIKVPAPAGPADVSTGDVLTSSEDVKPGPFVTRYRRVWVDGQEHIEFQDPVTKEWRHADTEWCDRCGFLIAENASGVACKSAESCPFHGKIIEYVAPPLPRPSTEL